MNKAQIAAGILAGLVVSSALAAPPAWRLQPESDPLEFGSLVLDPVQARPGLPDRWMVDFAVSQFNEWNHSRHILGLHRNWSREGESISEEELREVETLFPDRDVWHVDVEGWRADLALTRQIAPGVGLTIQIPWIEIGAPHWDAFSESVHHLLNTSNLGRDAFPRGDTFIYVKPEHNRRIIEAGDELARKGFGDISVSVSHPVWSLWRAEHRVVWTVELPTGKRGTLQGSGGVDLGAGWFAYWDGDRRDYRAAIGFSHLDRNGELLGQKRADTWHILLEVEQPLYRRLRGWAALRIDSSALWNVSHDEPGQPSWVYHLGILSDVGRGQWVSFDLSEEWYPEIGIAADWSFQLTWGFSPSL